VKKNLLKNKLFYYFYKVLKIYRNKKPSLHFGEFGEDIFINRIFKNTKNGKYIDVGCYHPFKGSLTAQLYNKNWKGINIDLSKTSIDLFKIARRRDINLNIAVSNFDGETVYYENSPVNQQNSLSKTNNQQTEIKIKCHTLNSILKQNYVENFDYLNVDVEGSELKVIQGINLTKYHPSLITIENNDLLPHDYYKDEVYKILIDNNYIFINRIGVTNFFLDKKLANNISTLIKI
jgi:FkbM family methyltransferase